MIPEHWKVGEYPLSVVEESALQDEDGDELLGRTDTFNGNIQINAGQCIHNKKCTLMHEFIHVMEWELGWNVGSKRLSELQVDGLAHLFVKFIKDNDLSFFKENGYKEEKE